MVGIDISTWIKEKLVDYVAPGDIGFTDFNAKFEQFVELGRSHDCYIYPQIQDRMGFTHLDTYQSPDQYRAVVQNFYGAGADGFSTQNYFDVEKYNIFKVLRDPNLLGDEDRHYVFYPLWGTIPGVPDGGYKGEIPYGPERIILNRQRLGERGAFRFRMCENLPAESKIDGAELISGAMVMFRPSIVPGDEIEIDINGEKIGAENISYEWSKEKDQPPTCYFALSSLPAVYGDNYLGMKLVKSAPDAKADIHLFEVEVIVKANG